MEPLKAFIEANREHLKKKELEEIAAAVGAKLVLIKAPKDGTLKDEEIELK